MNIAKALYKAALPLRPILAVGFLRQARMFSLNPKAPEEVMVIRELEGQRIITCSVPFYRFGFLRIGGRGTISKYPHRATAYTANVQAERRRFSH